MLISKCNVPGGFVRGFRELRDGSRVNWTPRKHNEVMYDAATITAKLLSGDNDYRLNGMYFEFQNVGDPDDAVTAPAFGRGDGVSYYNSLSSSPDIDYLRVPLIGATITSNDTDNYPGGNVLTLLARSLGGVATGVHGRTFSDTAISKVFGAALVAIPDPDDRTKDLVYARFYYDPSDQQVKYAMSEIGIEWSLPLS